MTYNDLEFARPVDEAQVEYMVRRFLGWRLPEDFRPDAGISYVRPNYGAGVDAAPTGTNLFDHAQATAMVRYMLEGFQAGPNLRPDLNKLRKLSEKASDGEWFVQHAATDSGLSRIDDGRTHGMFPIYGEAHEIELAAAAVNYVRDSLQAPPAAPTP